MRTARSVTGAGGVRNNEEPELAMPGLASRHFVMTSGELVRSLIAAGFDVRGMYGDTADSAFRPGSPRLLLVAERK